MLLIDEALDSKQVRAPSKEEGEAMGTVRATLLRMDKAYKSVPKEKGQATLEASLIGLIWPRQ